MKEFKLLQESLAQYLDDDQISKISEAYDVARRAHEGQKRRTGEPYITHPVAVATILSQMAMDQESVMAALLHDVLEDTAVTKEALAEQFGDAVAQLVDGVSKLTQIKLADRNEQQAENFRKMLLAMAKDIRVIIVKLADRLHNMRTLDALPNAKRKRISKETLEIYAPIANRLGMNIVRVELEELGFAAFYPMRARILKNAVLKARGNRKEIMSMIEASLIKGLEKGGIDASALQGREKHLYSVYKKMRTKQLSFSQIMDFYAFRIIVKDLDMCYRVLGLVHALYKPVPGRFKDYIAIPKANGYQSLHTTLFGPYGVPIEIQIRTEEMHQLAERGIAAHWMYKSPAESFSSAQAATGNWLNDLLEMQSNTGSSLEFMQNVKIDLFPDEVYVFTPKGDILELPSGATAVDFAYAVHTAVGNSCVAVRTDRALAPLSMPLLNGQTVEIITAPGARPNPAWLNFVITGKARSNIRHFLKTQQRSELVSLGRRLLESALNKGGASLEQISQEAIERVLKECKIKTLEDLFAEIGIGNRTAVLVARRCLDIDSDDTQSQAERSAPLAINGTEGMAINFAKCCWPIPGDPIVGFINFGQGLTIHSETCKNVAHFIGNPEKCVPLRWAESVERDFQVELKVDVINRRGILASLATAISMEQANIDTIRSEEKDERYSVINMILAVASRDHLAKIIRRIRGMKAVTRISRVRS